MTAKTSGSEDLNTSVAKLLNLPPPSVHSRKGVRAFQISAQILDVSRGQSDVLTNCFSMINDAEPRIKFAKPHCLEKQYCCIIYLVHGYAPCIKPGMFVGSSEGLPQRFIRHQHQTQSKIAVHVPAH